MRDLGDVCVERKFKLFSLYITLMLVKEALNCSDMANSNLRIKPFLTDLGD